MNKIIDFIRTSIGFQTLSVWIIVFVLAFPHNLWISVELSFIVALLTLTSIMAVYYFNQKVLIPKLMIRGRKVFYFVFSLLMLFFIINISARIETYLYYKFVKDPLPFYEFKEIFSMSKYIALLTMTFAISCMVSFARKAKETTRQKEELLSERKTLEARVLKSQINSHFVFNALNNIYSMTYFKDEYTSGYVLKLAQMMRYVMEDCETELTPLVKDIEYIENFIDFQVLRFECDKDITFTCRIDENVALSIPPMIFQPLVENCFKHTPLEVDKDSYIHILLEADENLIHFVAENSQPLLKHTTEVKNPGIGIENVKRRLDLYYDQRYTLDISNNPDSFKIELSIFLNTENSHVPDIKRSCC
ncbi:MAG: histidine kinase [Tannerella sp.]|jgi:sensor histidine kinase YesM|nr:histidine kinase [Tannerella sp.]